MKQDNLENKESILEDRDYFKGSIRNALKLISGTKKDMGGSKLVAKHPNGIVNIAKYDAKTNMVIQYNNVSTVNKKGTSILIYKLD